MGTYVVHYRLDNTAHTPGRCRTDHALRPGEVIYTGNGRAIVRSCRLEESTDATFQNNARALRVLSAISITKE